MAKPRNLRTLKPTVPRDELIDALANMELGHLTLEQVTERLGVTTEQLEELVTSDTTLEQEVSQAVTSARADPDRAVAASLEGLNSVASALAKRVAESHEQMTTAELSAAGSMFEKLTQIGESRKAEIKAAASDDDDDNPHRNLPVGGWDNRPRPNGKPWAMMYFLPPEHAAARDVGKYDPEQTDEQREERIHQWLDKWFPLTDDGEVIDLAYRIGRGGWWMTPDGKRHSGIQA